jgi:hypothetical protein
MAARINASQTFCMSTFSGSATRHCIASAPSALDCQAEPFSASQGKVGAALRVSGLNAGVTALLFDSTTVPKALYTLPSSTR